MTSEIRIGGEGMDETIFERASEVYDTLMPEASFVGGMPLETPLRWQKVHGELAGGGVGGEVARYLMIDYGDGRTAVLYKNNAMGGATLHSGEWELTAHTPRDDGSH